jgi:hypothetical protein
MNNRRMGGYTRRGVLQGGSADGIVKLPERLWVEISAGVGLISPRGRNSIEAGDVSEVCTTAESWPVWQQR